MNFNFRLSKISVKNNSFFRTTIKIFRMQKIVALMIVLFVLSCKQYDKKLTVQEIVDKSIAVSGGNLFELKTISFDFRGKTYTSETRGKQKILTRLLKNDTVKLLDVLSKGKLQRYKNDSLVVLPDSLAHIYANSVNSVHYFSKLPYGLNDPAVQKELLGEIEIKKQAYFKIKISFSQKNGGDDFDDTYLYWINKDTFKVDYLAYEYHTNGGGMRFREAYNERYVDEIRFVDYKNLKPKHNKLNILQIDSLYINDELKLLSTIEIENITSHVSGSYN